MNNQLYSVFFCIIKSNEHIIEVNIFLEQLFQKMTQSVSKNNILPEFLQYMIEISEDPVEFKSLEKEARKFYENHRNEKQIDSIVDRYVVTVNFKAIKFGRFQNNQIILRT